jgi:hypothetical protein
VGASADKVRRFGGERESFLGTLTYRLVVQTDTKIINMAVWEYQLKIRRGGSKLGCYVREGKGYAKILIFHFFFD